MDVSAMVAFLAPFLPYLVKVGGKAAEAASAQLGEAAWQRARELWQRLGPKVENKAAAQEAVEDVAAAPEDADRRAALRVQIGKVLQHDPALAEEVARVWQAAREEQQVRAVIASGERAVAVGGNVSGSISTGDTEHFH